jgi:DNA-3-methyladenine glycosylase II
MTERHLIAVRHLQAGDPVLAALIERAGACTLRRGRNRFWMLVGSILSQQLATGAARTIRRRVEELVPDRSAQALRRVRPQRLRAAGVSPQKAGYLADLCAAVHEGRIDLARIGRKADEAVIDELVQVKGIGRWTAQMFLIFSLGRLDVLPTADLGVRAAMRKLYGLAELPDHETATRIAQPWRPYASIASWYCWRALEFKD